MPPPTCIARLLAKMRRNQHSVLLLLVVSLAARINEHNVFLFADDHVPMTVAVMTETSSVSYAVLMADQWACDIFVCRSFNSAA